MHPKAETSILQLDVQIKSRNWDSQLRSLQLAWLKNRTQLPAKLLLQWISKDVKDKSKRQKCIGCISNCIVLSLWWLCLVRTIIKWCHFNLTQCAQWLRHLTTSYVYNFQQALMRFLWNVEPRVDPIQDICTKSPSHGHILNEAKDTTTVLHGHTFSALQILLQKRTSHIVASVESVDNSWTSQDFVRKNKQYRTLLTEKTSSFTRWSPTCWDGETTFFSYISSSRNAFAWQRNMNMQARSPNSLYFTGVALVDSHGHCGASLHCANWVEQRRPNQKGVRSQKWVDLSAIYTLSWAYPFFRSLVRGLFGSPVCAHIDSNMK